MEKQTADTPVKIRSARAATTAGFRLFTASFRHILRLTWFPTLVFALLSGITEALLVVYYPIVVVLLIPLWYVLYRFLLRPRLTMLPIVGAGLKTYLRHSGVVLTVAFATFIICAAIWLLTSVPAIILGIANIYATDGALYGDPIGMPSYMLWLTIAVFTMTSLMQAYIYLAFLFPVRFAFGSAAATDAERAQLHTPPAPVYNNPTRLL